MEGEGGGWARPTHTGWGEVRRRRFHPTCLLCMEPGQHIGRECWALTREGHLVFSPSLRSGALWARPLSHAPHVALLGRHRLLLQGRGEGLQRLHTEPP